MKNLLVFGATNNRSSINQKLAVWASSVIPDSTANVLDLNDFEMPIFSTDRERDSGIPEEAITFKNAIREADGLIISFAEHNSNFTAAFKNIYDWASRVDKSMWLDKPMFLMATSPGPRGAAGVLDIAVQGFPIRGGKVIASFSLPSFNNNFNQAGGITDKVLKDEFLVQLDKFINRLKMDEGVASVVSQ